MKVSHRPGKFFDSYPRVEATGVSWVAVPSEEIVLTLKLATGETVRYRVGLKSAELIANVLRSSLTEYAEFQRDGTNIQSAKTSGNPMVEESIPLGSE